MFKIFFTYQDNPVFSRDIDDFLLDNPFLFFLISISIILGFWKILKSVFEYYKKDLEEWAKKGKTTNLIKNDPTLQRLDKEIGDLNAKYSKDLRSNYTFMTLAKKYGVQIDGEDFDENEFESQFDKNEFLVEFEELLKEDESHDDMDVLLLGLPVSKIEIEQFQELCHKWRNIIDENSDIYLSEMTKARLIEYAYMKFDLRLSKYLTKLDLINEIQPKLNSIPKKSEKQIQNEIKNIKTEIYDSVTKILKNL